MYYIFLFFTREKLYATPSRCLVRQNPVVPYTIHPPADLFVRTSGSIFTHRGCVSFCHERSPRIGELYFSVKVKSIILSYSMKSSTGTFMNIYLVFLTVKGNTNRITDNIHAANHPDSNLIVEGDACNT